MARLELWAIEAAVCTECLSSICECLDRHWLTAAVVEVHLIPDAKWPVPPLECMWVDELAVLDGAD